MNGPGSALILRTNSKGTVLHMEISLQIWNWSRGMATTITKLLQDKRGFFFLFFLHGYGIHSMVMPRSVSRGFFGIVASCLHT